MIKGGYITRQKVFLENDTFANQDTRAKLRESFGENITKCSLFSPGIQGHALSSLAVFLRILYFSSCIELPLLLPCCWDFDLERQVFKMILYTTFPSSRLYQDHSDELWKQFEEFRTVQNVSTSNFYSCSQSGSDNHSRRAKHFSWTNSKQKIRTKFPQLLNWIMKQTNTLKTHIHTQVYSVTRYCCWLTDEYVCGWCQGCGLVRSIWMSIKVREDGRAKSLETYDMSRYHEVFLVRLAILHSSFTQTATSSRTKKRVRTHLELYANNKNL